MSHMAAKFNRSSNHKLWGDWRLKSKGNKATVYPTKLDDPQMLIQLFAKNLFEVVEDPAPIGSKLSKQEVQLTRTLPFKM